LLKYLSASGVNHKFKFSTSLARGLDYYTGMIFEGVLQGKDAEIGIGSIAGGGRYDDLIGMFSNN
jgi:histidyl-tRNA synthetase